MSETVCYYNENLRSISAVVEANNQQQLQQQQQSSLKWSTKIAPQPVTIIKVHHVPLSVNQPRPNTKSKLALSKSSKVAPCNGNVFYFDDRSDLTVTDVFGNRHGKNKRRTTDKSRCSKKSKCTFLFICLFSLLFIVLVIAIILIALFVPVKSSSK